MFGFYSENSTGEPPTLPSGSLNQDNDVQQGVNASISSTDNRSLTVEPDSGYEGTPSSITNPTDSQRFFGEQPVPQIPHSRQYSYDSLRRLYFQWDTFTDTIAEMGDSVETDSSNMETASSNCDNYSTASSNSDSFNRQYSHPIEIPSSSRPPQIIQNSIVDPDVDLRLSLHRPSRSQPLDFNRVQTNSYNPSSWPSSINLWRPPGAMSLPMFFRRSYQNFHMPGSNRLSPARSRRQIIDSDCSSLSSSDEDGPEDVFYMTVEEPSDYSLSPLSRNMGSPPLPDVVRQATDSRRNRSISVNLPPEPELLQRIGSRLREISDEFQSRRENRENRNRRRQTIGSISHFNGNS